MKKLNLGCGNDIKKGYVNLDVAKLPGVDVIWDINKLPLPFETEEFDEILCKDVIEHIEDYPQLLKELHRILKKGGVLMIRVPHFTSPNNFKDPTHKRLFSAESFNFFTLESEKPYYFQFAFSKIVTIKITFSRFYRFISSLINLNDFTRRAYEMSFLKAFFPALNIEVTLCK
jgi:ubiquinone/menaquinone biosynthesis C-methylase UbiE